MPEQRLRQQDANLLSALQLAHLALVQFIRDVETLKQNGRVALGRVAVFLADDAFEFSQTHAVFVRQLVFGIKRIALLQRLPQRPVAHDDGVDDTEIVECELILTQNADFWAR